MNVCCKNIEMYNFHSKKFLVKMPSRVPPQASGQNLNMNHGQHTCGVNCKQSRVDVNEIYIMFIIIPLI